MFDLQLADGTGTGSRLALWNQPGSDITGMVARVEKVAKTCEQVERYDYGFANRAVSQVHSSKKVKDFVFNLLLTVLISQ